MVLDCHISSINIPQCEVIILIASSLVCMRFIIHNTCIFILSNVVTNVQQAILLSGKHCGHVVHTFAFVTKQCTN